MIKKQIMITLLFLGSSLGSQFIQAMESKGEIEIISFLKRHNMTLDEVETSSNLPKNVFLKFVNKPSELSQREWLAAMAAELINGKTDLSIQNRNGQTALIKAARHGYKDIVELLLIAGANINIQDKNGQTALIKAAKWGHKDIVGLLLTASTNLANQAFHIQTINIQDKYGRTALIEAALEGHRDIVELLVTAGANPNIQDNNGKTALIEAAKWGYKDMVEFLLNSNAKPEIKTHQGKTALDYALPLELLEPELVNLLRSNKAVK